MSDQALPDSVQDLTQQLAALTKRLAELELKFSGTPLTEQVLEKKNEDDAKQAKLQKESEEEGSDPRIKVIISRRHPETGEPIEESGKLKAAKEERDASKHGIVLRKNVYPSKLAHLQLDDSSEIEVLNPFLWDLLKEHLGDYPNHTFRESAVTLYSPYEPLVFEYDRLRHVADETPKDDNDKQARKDLHSLLDAMSGGASGDESLDKYFKMRPNYFKTVSGERASEPQTVTFMDLWTVFPPGTLVYGKPFQDQHQVFVVKDNLQTWPFKDEQRSGGRDYFPWKLEAWSYDLQDRTFRRADYTLIFEDFDGHLPLEMLPYYPFQLHPQHADVREELIERGKLFRRYCQAKEGERLFLYDGRAVHEKTGFSNMKQMDEGDSATERGQSFSDWMTLMSLGRRRNTGLPTRSVKSSDIKSRVMVDYESYFQYGPSDGRNGPLEPSANASPGCGCSDCRANKGLMGRYRTRFDDSECVNRKIWEDEQYLICPPRVLGYILQEKQWAQLQVTCLSELSTDTATEKKRLKLADDPQPKGKARSRGANFESTDTSTISLLLDLVRSHTSTISESNEHDNDRLEIDDIIPGKGKGLVVLLYGPPGVGKTSTAEILAIETKKPLFSVSVADVGTQAKHVESNLARIFALATRWKAILLLDEADVFLESRGRGTKIQSTDKNALVSVFLRVLEYYQGIMILTTNQIANFDVAIPSRIHVAIKYEPLKERQMKAIFEEFLDGLDEIGAIKDYDAIHDWLESVVYREQFDGRQIRNLITTALGLARADKERGRGRQLSKDHMSRAFTIASDFKRAFEDEMRRYMDSQGRLGSNIR